MNYVLIDWKELGNILQNSAEADLIFIPNFNDESGKELIKNNNEKFISLMLIFGQIKILQVILKNSKYEMDKLKN